MTDDSGWAPTIPELVVTDFAESLAFYTDLLGFDVMYVRGAPSFAMLRLGRVQLMIEQLDDEVWMTGELTRPFGRGMNLEMEHPDPASLAEAVVASGRPLFRPVTSVTRDIGEGVTSTSIEFLVQDPDGYLLRFVSP